MISMPDEKAANVNTPQKYESHGVCQGKRQFDLSANNGLPFVRPIDLENQILQSANLTAPSANIFIGKKHDCQKDSEGNHSRGEDCIRGAIEVNGILHCAHRARIRSHNNPKDQKG